VNKCYEFAVGSRHLSFSETFVLSEEIDKLLTNEFSNQVRYDLVSITNAFHITTTITPDIVGLCTAPYPYFVVNPVLRMM